MKNLFSILLTIAGLVVVFFGVYAITDGVTQFLHTVFGLNIQQAVAGAQAFEFAGRTAVTMAVVWCLAHAIRDIPSVDWETIINLLRERGVMLALLIGAIMAASMQHRLYWLISKITDPEHAYQHTDLVSAANGNMIALFSFAMLFVLFYEKGETVHKPVLITSIGLLIGIMSFWTAALLV